MKNVPVLISYYGLFTVLDADVTGIPFTVLSTYGEAIGTKR